MRKAIQAIEAETYAEFVRAGQLHQELAPFLLLLMFLAAFSIAMAIFLIVIVSPLTFVQESGSSLTQVDTTIIGGYFINEVFLFDEVKVS